jgi:hypothetical protein
MRWERGDGRRLHGEIEWRTLDERRDKIGYGKRSDGR